jgi:fumarate hydratase subunit beta
MLKIQTPLTDKVVRSLKAGDEVAISGFVYTARDAAHKRLCELIADGKELPIDLKGAVIYFVGPTPARPGRPIGSAGPRPLPEWIASARSFLPQASKQ